MAHRELRRSVLPVVLLATVVLAATGYGYSSGPPPSSANESQHIGKILSVRKVLENRYFVSRYPQVHYYLLYFAVRASDQTYCAEYETPVLDEIDDLLSAKDKDVEFCAQRQEPHLENAEGSQVQGSLSGTKAVLTNRWTLMWLVFQNEGSSLDPTALTDGGTPAKSGNRFERL